MVRGMTRKTGKALQRARMQMRAARLARLKKKLAEHGVSLRPQKPSKRAIMEKEKELMSLYQELMPSKTEEEIQLEEVVRPEPKKKPEEKQAG
jgi:hypothetical protein